MPLIPDSTAFQKTFATFPLATYEPGEIAIAAGSKIGRLLILRKGAVAIVKEGTEIAKVTDPGAVFGELSALLDQPHTADVRALERSEFYVADAAVLLVKDPVALVYVAAVLAQRLDRANHAFIELKGQIQTDQPRSVIGKTLKKMEELLSAAGNSYVHDGYPIYHMGF